MNGETDGGAMEAGAEERLERRIGRLRAAVILLAVTWLGLAGWIVLRPPVPPEVLEVERLDIVEPDGQPAFVLANSERAVPATIEGRVLLEGQERERANPSFIFFDGHGDEVGGMLFRNRETAEGFQATRHLSMDGFRQDQTVVLTHSQDPGGARSGLQVNDVPGRSILETLAELGLEPPATRQELDAAVDSLAGEEGEAGVRRLFGVDRLFVGSDRANEATLVLRDGAGRPRIRLGVPDEGDPYVRVLDEEGEPVVELP